MELASSSVFVDFDGTITDVDTCVHLLDRLVPPEWREIEVLYDAGVIGSRECIAREWSLLAGDRSEIEAVSREVGIDEGLSALVEFLRSAGAEVTIVSDGFGLRVVEIAKWAGVGVMSNLVDWESGSVVFPNGDPSCECALCGECKRAPIRDARRRGRTTILVGDGASDIKAAAEADIVFAKNRLADWCEAQGLPFLRFSSLGEVHAALVDGVSARAPG